MWCLIAFFTSQMYRRSVSFFVNGLGDGYSATATVQLDDIFSDSSGSYRIGQSLDGKREQISFVISVSVTKRYSLQNYVNTNNTCSRAKFVHGIIWSNYEHKDDMLSKIVCRNRTVVVYSIICQNHSLALSGGVCSCRCCCFGVCGFVCFGVVVVLFCLLLVFFFGGGRGLKAVKQCLSR